jgi:hypothetical protein
VVDVIERETAGGIDLVTAQRMFVVILDSIQRQSVEPVARAVADRVPSPSALKSPIKKRMRR